MKIEEIDWHDQILNGIKIDRNKPGINDSIEIFVIVDETQMVLVCEDVYQLEMNMNFGVIANESIRHLVQSSNDDRLLEIRNEWESTGANLENLFCLKINTNSTNSLIRIYALSYKIIPVVDC